MDHGGEREDCISIHSYGEGRGKRSKGGSGEGGRGGKGRREERGGGEGGRGGKRKLTLVL